MRKFACPACDTQVFFENDRCGACATALGFDSQVFAMVACADAGRLRCANYGSGACNWLVERGEDGAFCRACRHNRTIPDLSISANVFRWREFEAAKRRLFYALIALGLPLRTRSEDPYHGLAFDCVDDEARGGDTKRVFTGHDNGVITIALAETDPAKREAARLNLGESYRTLLGHLRHEIGHYYWDLLVRDRPQIVSAFRILFGDDRADYSAALKSYYCGGPAADWPQRFVTAYASSHPWEDFAESWQHYMHIVDTLETARAFHVAVDGLSGDGERSRAPFDPYHADLDALFDAWAPLTVAINALNRSMGQPDIYPFVLPPAALTKMAFVRDVAAQTAR